MKNLIILGTGGFAREVLWLVREINAAASTPVYKVLGFAAESGGDDMPDGFAGPPLLGDDNWVQSHLDARDALIVAAIGQPKARERAVQSYLAKGFKPATLVHPQVSKSEFVRLGQGCILCAGARLTVELELGRFCIVNLNATVGHDSRLGAFCTVHPGANLSGNVSLGKSVEVGTGAVLLPGVSAGDGAVIGAGAVVTRDLNAGKTYVGVPARKRS